MPAVSKRQQRFMGAELERKREGKKTKTGMSSKQLGDFAGTKQKGLPERKHVGRGDWGKKEGQSAGGSKTLVSREDSLHDAAHSTNMEEYRNGQGMGSVVNPVITGKK